MQRQGHSIAEILTLTVGLRQEPAPEAVRRSVIRRIPSLDHTPLEQLFDGTGSDPPAPDGAPFRHTPEHRTGRDGRFGQPGFHEFRSAPPNGEGGV